MSLQNELRNAANWEEGLTSQVMKKAADALDALTTELAAAKKDATAARANLAWIAKNIEGANYDRWTERAGIAEEAKAILRRQRKPDSDELQYLALYDAATGSDNQGEAK
jgi:hypothetical protein